MPRSHHAQFIDRKYHLSSIELPEQADLTLDLDRVSKSYRGHSDRIRSNGYI